MDETETERNWSNAIPFERWNGKYASSVEESIARDKLVNLDRKRDKVVMKRRMETWKWESNFEMFIE